MLRWGVGGGDHWWLVVGEENYPRVHIYHCMCCNLPRVQTHKHTRDSTAHHSTAQYKTTQHSKAKHSSVHIIRQATPHTHIQAIFRTTRDSTGTQADRIMTLMQGERASGWIVG